jgi:HSP20 family protein
MALSVTQTDSPRRGQPTSMGRPTSVERWQPFQELEQFNEQFARLMDSVWSPTRAGNGGGWVPLADVEETEDAWIIEAELPSVDRGDVNVELRDSELIISGEIKEKERKGVLRKRARRTGEFEYRVVLPGQADEEHIEANLHDGVLTVRLPKAEGARPRHIEVKAA